MRGVLYAAVLPPLHLPRLKSAQRVPIQRIVELRPGIYTVTFSLTGSSTGKREGVDLWWRDHREREH